MQECLVDTHVHLCDQVFAEDMDEVLERAESQGIVGHAGSGSGLLLLVPPSITRSRQKQKLVRRLPLACLLLETDAPVLGPFPAERNEPANLVTSLQAVAEIKDVSEQQVREAVCENVCRLYGGFKP